MNFMIIRKRKKSFLWLFDLVIFFIFFFGWILHLNSFHYNCNDCEICISAMLSQLNSDCDYNLIEKPKKILIILDELKFCLTFNSFKSQFFSRAPPHLS